MNQELKDRLEEQRRQTQRLIDDFHQNGYTLEEVRIEALENYWNTQLVHLANEVRARTNPRTRFLQEERKLRLKVHTINLTASVPPSGYMDALVTIHQMIGLVRMDIAHQQQEHDRIGVALAALIDHSGMLNSMAELLEAAGNLVIEQEHFAETWRMVKEDQEDEFRRGLEESPIVSLLKRAFHDGNVVEVDVENLPGQYL